MGKTKNHEGLPKESLLQVFEMNQEKFRCLINHCSILLYKKEEAKDLIALEADNEYFKEFCTRFLQNDTIEKKTINTVYDMRDWVKTIKFVWHEKWPSESKFRKMLSYGILLLPFKNEGDSNTIFIRRNKRWNQVIIHIF